jgi:hypothetical protein
MRIACWITKATDAHSEHVTLFFFHGNNGFACAPQCYLVRTFYVTLATAWTSHTYLILAKSTYFVTKFMLFMGKHLLSGALQSDEWEKHSRRASAKMVTALQAPLNARIFWISKEFLAAQNDAALFKLVFVRNYPSVGSSPRKVVDGVAVERNVPCGLPNLNDTIPDRASVRNWDRCFWHTPTKVKEAPTAPVTSLQGG